MRAAGLVCYNITFCLCVTYWLSGCRDLPESHSDLIALGHTNGMAWARNGAEVRRVFAEIKPVLAAARARALERAEAVKKAQAAAKLRAAISPTGFLAARARRARGENPAYPPREIIPRDAWRPELQPEKVADQIEGFHGDALRGQASGLVPTRDVPQKDKRLPVIPQSPKPNKPQGALRDTRAKPTKG